MNLTLKILRFIFVTVLLCFIVVPATFYIMMSTDWAQQRLRQSAQSGLTRLLGTDVEIGDVDFIPFNRLRVSDVTVADDNDSIALSAKTIEARFELTDFIFDRKLIIDYARISGLDLNIYRDSIGAPLNISGILARLKKDEQKDEPTNMNLAINGLVIEQSHLAYNVLNVAETPGRFNPNHVNVSDITAEIYAPTITNDVYSMELHRLSAHEQSGFDLQNMGFMLTLSQTELALSNLYVEMPGSALSFAEIQAPLPDGLKGLGRLFTASPVDLSVTDGSHLYLPDLKAFVPVLGNLDIDAQISADATVSADSISLRKLRVNADNGNLSVTASGNAAGFADPKTMRTDAISLRVDAAGAYVEKAVRNAGMNLPANVSEILSRAGIIQVNGNIEGNPGTGELDITLSTAYGSIIADADYHEIGEHAYAVDASLDFDLSKMSVHPAFDGLGDMDGSATMNGQIVNKKFAGELNAVFDHVNFNGYTYSDIDLTARLEEGVVAATLSSNDPEAVLSAYGQGIRTEDGKLDIHGEASIVSLDLNALNFIKGYEGYNLSGDLDVNAAIRGLDEIKGRLDIRNVACRNSDGEGVSMKAFTVTADTGNERGNITVASDYLNLTLLGQICPSTIVQNVRGILSDCFPELSLPADDTDGCGNDFVYDLTIENAEDLCRFLNLPVQVIHPIAISGRVARDERLLSLSVDAPWLFQGDKLLESTMLSGVVDGAERHATLYATTEFSTKKGPMNIVALLDGRPGRVDTNIDWMIERTIPLNGSINFSTAFNREPSGDFSARVDFNPGEINFGEEVWKLHPSSIEYVDKKIRVSDFSLVAPDQAIRVNGIAGETPEDILAVSLSNIQLIEIFETLEIYNALIGGRATGDIYASALLSKQPIIQSPNIHVKDISYNYCTLGDADVKMQFDNDMQAFRLDADVVGEDNRKSKIFGHIIPATEGLDITFDVDRVKVGFLKPFMQAFASDIKGYASGRARLFGTFKYIDLEGDVYADSVALKIDFTNTWYTASDSIRIRPHAINLDSITIRDVYGHRATLNGRVAHDFFKAPVFDFAITEAKDFLCYDVNSKQSPDWYGRVFGDGSAHVHGEPGKVDISVNMATTENSIFTFVLSDTEVADEYSFITFRDATPIEVHDSIVEASSIPPAVIEYRNRMAQAEESGSSIYNMDIQVDITPVAQMIIVMDPIGGDRIKAYGSGNMRLTYGSADNDLRMYGTYTLDRGSYNFTLQDIIIKDFTIKEGSSITFRGDPYSAQLNIEAIYSVNANLSDLDESFLQDKELNRTNVPVHALMKVTGDMRQPEINFDLEFPSLTQDVYRKVRSIVSTDEMMNRQIIYLLALNRFYTPDYMSSTTRGNELFSVASSTISSQLSSMLGKLSENWSIAPNLRSDRGDFSDLEVDLTLSSNLLNNRLLFNGNLGYRDKSLNTNRFVGDFDVEYLLNRKGSWRLKAYNRYNDQNYYLRTALTTQGIGLMYRRDFDSLFPSRKKKAEQKNVPTVEITPDTPADSIVNSSTQDDFIIFK